MTNRNERLKSIRERLSAATPGPWMESTQSFDIVAPHAPTFMKGNIRIVVGNPDVLTGDDAELIAHAPSDIAYLLALVERYEKALEWYTTEDGQMGDMGATAREALEAGARE